ncbi:hypothetical protein OKW45_004298 [Paraburkholderia sp. WSM4175]|uniref:DUF1643 domain-containing protein n=1 Tax=Paraburkholderia sp. WSM4175 TaxID=2991072 RepID=UPI003D1F193A
MSAILSECGTYRYRLERRIETAVTSHTVAYIGMNPSTADATLDDATVRKWRGFTIRYGGSHFVVGNLFAYRATDVCELAAARDPVGPENDEHLRAIMANADVVIPCWGIREKVPRALRYRFDQVEAMLLDSGRQIKTFGFSKYGDPLHPLRLAYSTPLVDWSR